MSWPPDPIAFHLGPAAIRWYGLWSALGFLAAAIHWVRRAQREGRGGGFGIDFAVWVTLAGLLGGRLAFVAANLPYFVNHPGELLRIDRGGLIYYGGFLLATLVVWIQAKRKGEPGLAYLDFGVSAMPLAHALGRIGCLFNGCCRGISCEPPWGWPASGGVFFPVQLAETLFNLTLYVVLLRVDRPGRPGRLLGLYGVSYGLWRFSIEFLRGDARTTWGSLHIAQWVSLAFIGIGVLLLARTRPAKSS